MSEPTIRIGVSACLLGKKVRHDGGHKHSRYLTEILSQFFELVPMCPEAEVGMGTPRESVRLSGDVEAPEMISRSGVDWTTRMNRYSRKRVKQLATDDLHGFVFMKRSPSCGLFRVPVMQENGQPLPGRGLFALEYTRAFPHTPVEEIGRLSDPRLRENFLERVFAHARVQRLFGGRWKRGDVVAFHSREKYFLLAHSQKHYKELGRMVAAIADYKPAEFRDRYFETYMEGLSVKATKRRHVNTLQHIAGHLREHVSDAERERIHTVIQDFGAELVPLVVPVTLLRHYIEIHDIPYVRDQIYLSPSPKELMVRNHV
jgi:uncharacterized protein YbgA (DUF1722 family)/uncharacterized protein YbbK (DUF523 family)